MPPKSNDGIYQYTMLVKCVEFLIQDPIWLAKLKALTKKSNLRKPQNKIRPLFEKVTVP